MFLLVQMKASDLRSVSIGPDAAGARQRGVSQTGLETAFLSLADL